MYQTNMAPQQPLNSVNQQFQPGQQVAYSPAGAMPTTAITSPQPVAPINTKPPSVAPPTYNP